MRNWKTHLCLLSSAVMLLLSSSARAENTTITPVPRSFPTNWMSRHEALVVEAKKGGVDILFLGDSITDGWHWDKGGVNVWKKCYAPRHAANFGIGWDRIQNVLWRIEHGELEGLDPKVIVLLIGTNNAGYEDNGKPRNTTPEIVEGIGTIVHVLRAKLPKSKILLLGLFPRGQKDDPIRDQVKAINRQIAKLDDGRMIAFLDIGQKFLEPDGTLSREIMPDLLHPSEKGYQIWADAMEGTLDKLLK